MFAADESDPIHREKEVILQLRKRRNAGVKSLSRQEEQILCIRDQF